MNWKISAYSALSRINWLDRAVQNVRDHISHRQYSKRGSFAQHDEDRFLLSYFGDLHGRYVDIGANHPFRISNTYLLYNRGWTGIVVEPIKKLCELHRLWRPKDVHCCVAMGQNAGQMDFFELIPSVLSTFSESQAMESIREGAVLKRKEQVAVWTLSLIFQEYFSSEPIDLLSVDVEGLDYEVLMGNDWSKYKPRLVVFESQPGSESITPSDRLLLDQNYKMIKQLGCNRIYEKP